MILDGELTICPSYGWTGGPEFNTLIKTLRSGAERRSPRWERVRHRYSLPYSNIRNAAYLNEIKAIFLTARGSAHSFFVKDESDYLVANAAFGVGDGAETAFPLTITSAFGTFEYVRTISYPVNPTFTVNGSAAPATFDVATGLVTFETAPADLSVIRWSGEFRILVRFVSDTLSMSIDSRFADGPFAMSGSVDLMEVLE